MKSKFKLIFSKMHNTSRVASRSTYDHPQENQELYNLAFVFFLHNICLAFEKLQNAAKIMLSFWCRVVKL
jgi:hypothetical protein